jgi:glycosyltransferase involved in cell wall biosynthesis
MRVFSVFPLLPFSDEERSALYRGARFTVIPSFDERWGLAVQESLAHGTPCIASPVGGIPEAGLDLVNYVTCSDVNELADAIGNYADEGLLECARKKIRNRLANPAKLPTWQDAVETIARIARLPHDQLSPS